MYHNEDQRVVKRDQKRKRFIKVKETSLSACPHPSTVEKYSISHTNQGRGALIGQKLASDLGFIILYLFVYPLMCFLCVILCD